MPDSVDVFDGVADLLAKLLLVKLHLQGQKQERQLHKSSVLSVLRNVSIFRGCSFIHPSSKSSVVAELIHSDPLFSRKLQAATSCHCRSSISWRPLSWRVSFISSEGGQERMEERELFLGDSGRWGWGRGEQGEGWLGKAKSMRR